MTEETSHKRPFSGVPEMLCRAAGLAALCIGLASTPAMASPVAKGGGLFVVGNDRGGVILSRLKELRRLRSSAKRVEIRGRMCLSSCTMYLGLPQTCVSAETTFGFHGPSLFGLPMGRRDFENTSRIIASNYPTPLREWYMSKARYEISGFKRMSGATLIELGVPECPVSG
ncbi:MAG: hypothetical protein JXQ91_08640 [Vannielia sp.]|uniref:hypothetical protein n=1 Tax=Vannielia sp. TaxID=2813045 RepID=UPI003B8B4299